MKQSLQIKLGQQLTMTPQLQQAIRLLQLSSLDLQLEVQQAVESNPMLELAEDDDELEERIPQGESEQAEAAESSATSAGADQGSVEDGDGGEHGADGDWNESIPEDLPVDSSWDDVYSAPATASGASAEDMDLDARNSAPESLADHLLSQLNLSRLSERDQLIATAVIDAINADGLLTASSEELCAGLPAELEIEPDEVEAVVHHIQNFDPPGIAARDLRECLSLQLRDMTERTSTRAVAHTIVDQHMDRLGNRDFAGIMRRTRLTEAELTAALKLIQSLNPRPGSIIAPAETAYVIPDALVRKANGRWWVELNPEATPRLRIHAEYAGLVRRADSSSENTYLRNNLQEARWFLKSLQSRNETLLKVASRIVEHQRDFLEHGPEAMKPLVLSAIAEDVGMHESTVSRVTTRKYLHTPRGIFELKYFFSSHVGTASGGEVSSTAIRAMIRKLTDDENPQKPLSDSKIVSLLLEQEITVARRTVAKYRESMAIPPSNERKRLV